MLGKGANIHKKILQGFTTSYEDVCSVLLLIYMLITYKQCICEIDRLAKIFLKYANSFCFLLLNRLDSLVVINADYFTGRVFSFIDWLQKKL